MDGVVLCEKCKQRVPDTVLACKCGKLFFCSKYCHDKVLRFHKKECPGLVTFVFKTKCKSCNPFSAYLGLKKSGFSAPLRIAPLTQPPATTNQSQSDYVPAEPSIGYSSQTPGSPTTSAWVEQSSDNLSGSPVVLVEGAGGEQQAPAQADVYDRDPYGRFSSNGKSQEPNQQKVTTHEVKERNKAASRVTKWKASAVDAMKKIKSEWYNFSVVCPLF